MRKLLLILCFVLVLPACKQDMTIRGREYILQDYPDTEVLLGFDAHENRFYGEVVNRYFGDYNWDGAESLKMQVQGSTMMMGKPTDMDFEYQYLQDLALVNRIKINPTDIVLYLSDGRTLTYNLKKSL